MKRVGGGVGQAWGLSKGDIYDPEVKLIPELIWP